MTVIATLITRRGTIHVTDSLITQRQQDGTYEALEWKNTKIVPVTAWRGAMSYWGLASVGGQWTLLDWLREQVKKASNFDSAEAFANDVAQKLNRVLSRWKLPRTRDAGIGIHFTAYERIADRWIPELFLISNWGDTSYSSLRPAGVGVSRETYGTISGQGPRAEHFRPEFRVSVHDYILNQGWLRYNNGDPKLFNPIADTIMDMLGEMNKRSTLRDVDRMKTQLSLARTPVEFVSRMQLNFCLPETRVVGGAIHDLAISPEGDYQSTSKDGS
jgi:hypothetical protein